MKRKKIFLLLAAVFMLSGIFSQDSAFFFSARVVNTETGAPVSNAKISLIGTFRSTFTNERGEFTILLNKKKCIVEISAAFFSTTWVSVPCLVQPQQTILLRAKPNSGKLNPTQKDIPAEKVFSPGEWDLRDYDFYGKNILLLLHNKNTGYNKLLVLSSSLETKNEVALRNAPTGFFTDYEGGRNIVSEENAVKFSWDEKKGISFSRELPVKKFENSFFKYLTSDSVNIYFKFDSPPEYFVDENLGLKIRIPTLTYYGIDRKTRRQSLLKNIWNEKATKPVAGEKKYTDLGLTRIPFSNGNTEFSQLKAPVFKQGNHICIIDFLNRKFENYDSVGKLGAPVNFYFYPEKLWNNDFYMDAMTEKFYSTFFHIGMPINITMKEISSLTGKVISSVATIPEEFPEQVKVNDGYVYFLKRENNGGISLRRLKLSEK